MDTQQEAVYKDLGVPILESALNGYNGTIFAYGQTGAGKTHSITGTFCFIDLIGLFNYQQFRYFDYYFEYQ